MSTEGWEVRFSKSRQVPYFYNRNTSESTWEPPQGLSNAQIGALPGARKYLYGESSEKQDKVRASHLLVKYRGSRRPSSWKEANITRSEEEARQILKGYQAQIGTSAERFADLAREHSDCSSHSQGGDLGWFGHGQMQKPFEETAFGLPVGAISDVIKSDSGLHLILRTG